MGRMLSTPLRELPGFLSTISMVVDDRRSIVDSLVQAERKSPSRYEPAKALFCRVLEGDLNVTQAITQARKVFDEVERKCALEILEASQGYLARQSAAHVGPFPSMSVTILNGLNLSVAPLWPRHLNPQRLMVLHFWRKPLTQWQLGAAGAVIRSALTQHHPEFAGCEIDFISVPLPESASRRRFELHNWTTLKPLDDKNLRRFWKQFCDAWSVYQGQEPREIRRRRSPDLFGGR